MKKTLTLSATAGFLLFLSACNSTTASLPDDTTPPPPNDQQMSSSVPADPAPQARVIEMTVDDWKFAPNAITVKKGEKVVVRLTGGTGEHSFMSKDLGINVTINPGETKDVEIPTDAAGIFSFRCAVPCGPGHRDMTGTIVVEG